jgi:exodeoxyribonuclease V alpha subunit
VKDDALDKLTSAGAISSLDIHFARFLERLNGVRSSGLVLAAALVSAHVRQGHICIGLKNIGGKSMEGAAQLGPLPGPGAWCAELAKTKVVGRPGEYKPLVLDDAGRLYLYRYWEYQRKLADNLRARIGETAALPSPGALKDQLDRLFPPAGTEVDWQKIAAFAGASKKFCVISGGPGTGKTTTIARILAILLEQYGPGALRIALAAPTGKAAARLQEAIKDAKSNLTGLGYDLHSMPDSASTIHRLLGFVQGTPYFVHNEANPLPVDVLVIDEASMADLALMSKLVQALPPHARLILLGDKDQLSSVEAGAVLGDICDTGSPISFSTDFADACQEFCGCRPEDGSLFDAAAGKPKDCIIQLRKNYRFAGDSGIALLSSAVREKDDDRAVRVLREGGYPDLAWNEAPSCKLLGKLIESEVIEGFKDYAEAVEALRHPSGEDPDERLKKIFELLEGFRILAAVRAGPCGVAALNDLVEEILTDAHLVNANREWYVGRPVMVGRNDYNLRLFNGDIGIYLPDILSGMDFTVFFQGPGGNFRPFNPLRLPQHETVYAMTVHKSQGSEFDKVMLVLPDRDTPVLTRELVYTAITRARQKVSLWGGEQILRAAITRSAERLSGLSESLWGEE